MKDLVVVNDAGTMDATTRGFDFSIADKWIAFAQVKPSSVKAYHKAIKRLAEFLSSNHIAHPTRADMMAYREHLAQTYKPTTANLYLSACRMFFSFLQSEGIIAVNPAQHLKGFKVSSEHKKSALDAAAVKSIIGKFDDTGLCGLRDKAMFATMAVCGLRTIEISRANLEDIEVVGDTIKLHVQGKGRDDRAEYVIVPAGVYRLIKAYLDKRGVVEGTAPLFASIGNRNAGGRLTSTSISHIVKAALRGAGFDTPRLTAHSLRHSAATLSLMAGASIREVQQLLRHRNVSVTQVYLHEMDALNNRASNLTASVLGI